MASYHGHLMASSLVGTACGSFAAWKLELGWGPVFLGAGLTTIAGLLPDLDSENSIPVRELFSIAAVLVPLLLLCRLLRHNMPPDEILVVLGGAYVGIRYVLAALVRRLTVHRGMFHSIPAMLITGLGVFLLYKSGEMTVRLFLAGSTMLGFLSHLVLDEIYSVDFMGLQIRLKKSAGSALKLASSSLVATLTTYLVLGGLGYLVWEDAKSELITLWQHVTGLS